MTTEPTGLDLEAIERHYNAENERFHAEHKTTNQSSPMLHLRRRALTAEAEVERLRKKIETAMAELQNGCAQSQKIELHRPRTSGWRISKALEALK